MSQAAEPKPGPSWPARAGQFVVAACALVGLKAYQKTATPPPRQPPFAIPAGLSKPGPIARPPMKPGPTPARGLGPPRFYPLTAGSSPAPGIAGEQSRDDYALLFGGAPAFVPATAARRKDAPAAVQVAPAAAPPPETSLEIATAAEVDERLFLLRALESLYEGWPAGEAGPGSLGPAIDALRHEATRHQRYILERGFDDRIASLYGDLIALLDTYADCLSRAGRIERDGAALAGRERTEAATRSGLTGAVMAGKALRDGASGGEALATWAGVTIVGTLAGELAKGPARDEAKRQAAEANVREFSARHSEAVARAEGAALALTDRFGWAPGEAGFDATPQQTRQVLEMVARGDAAGLLRLVEIAGARRPRDPFARSVVAFRKAQALGRAATPDSLAHASDECVAAATLVPKGAFYDPYRAGFLALAGLAANAATICELGERGWIAGPAARGPRTLSIWRAYLAGDPRDPAGEAREQLAWALASTGRFADAATAAAQVADLRGNDPDFAYSYACLLSLTGRADDSLRWLEHAFRVCRYPDILHAKSDPDLATVRASRAAGFGELAAVKFAWSIDWGFFDHDDVCLVNNSPFPLTGVTLDLAVDSKGSARWAKVLTADRIEPGATHRWRTWVTARGKDADGKATLLCDQQR